MKNKAFLLKGRLYTLTVLAVLNTDIKQFEQQLIELTEKAPKLFRQAPVVLDFSEVIAEESIDLNGLCSCLRQYGLLPVAVQAANPIIETQAQCMSLAILSGSSSYDKPIDTNESQMAAPPASKLLNQPVRSGQQIVSRGDLIVVAPVSHGAELFADGSIHVYGALRGRALAGIAGDKEARIFCQSLDAELISIAGFYRLRDGIPSTKGPCQIYLQDDHIHIDPL